MTPNIQPTRSASPIPASAEPGKPTSEERSADYIRKMDALSDIQKKPSAQLNAQDYQSLLTLLKKLNELEKKRMVLNDEEPSWMTEKMREKLAAILTDFKTSGITLDPPLPDWETQKKAIEKWQSIAEKDIKEAIEAGKNAVSLSFFLAYILPEQATKTATKDLNKINANITASKDILKGLNELKNISLNKEMQKKTGFTFPPKQVSGKYTDEGLFTENGIIQVNEKSRPFLTKMITLLKNNTKLFGYDKQAAAFLESLEKNAASLPVDKLYQGILFAGSSKSPAKPIGAPVKGGGSRDPLNRHEMADSNESQKNESLTLAEITNKLLKEAGNVNTSDVSAGGNEEEKRLGLSEFLFKGLSEAHFKEIKINPLGNPTIGRQTLEHLTKLKKTLVDLENEGKQESPPIDRNTPNSVPFLLNTVIKDLETHFGPLSKNPNPTDEQLTEAVNKWISSYDDTTSKVANNVTNAINSCEGLKTIQTEKMGQSKQKMDAIFQFLISTLKSLKESTSRVISNFR